MANRRLRSLLLLASLFAHGQASAADSATGEAITPAAIEAVVLDRQRVTASVLPTTPAAASQHVTVLTRSDLAAARGQSLSEILARQAGLHIDRSAGNAGFAALYLRGADPSHVVLLIDHVRQNDPLSSRGSAVDLNTVSVEEVERIEIVRGNASVANAEAIAGLIHIFTRRDGAGSSVGAGVGGDGLRAGRAAWADASGVRASATWREEQGAGGASHRLRSGNAGWQGGFDTGLQVQAAVRFSDSDNTSFPDDSGGLRHAVLRSLDSRRSNSRQVSLRGEYAADPGVLEAQVLTLSRNGWDSTPGVAPGVRDPFGLPAIDGSSDYRREEAQLVWRQALGPDAEFSLGGWHQRERGRFDSLIDFGLFTLPAAFAVRRTSTSGFAEARWEPGAWSFQAGVRYTDLGGDAAAGDDRASHPMFAFQHSLGPGLGRWGASIARASKPPSFFALGQPLVGNPALRPERVVHRELFYGNAEDSSWPVRITLFSARYRDLVDFESGPPPQLVNRGRIETEGVEWRVGHRAAAGWNLHVEGTWMRVRDPDGATELRHRPKIQFGAQFDVPLGHGRDLALLVRHVGRRFDSSIATGDLWLQPATRVDLSLRQTIGPARLILGLDNLGDARDEETIGTPMPGTRVRLFLEWDLS